MRLIPRVEALEAREPDWKPWHRIIVPVGDTSGAARVRFEAENGPIGDDNLLLIRLVEPAPRLEDGHCLQ